MQSNSYTDEFSLIGDVQRGSHAAFNKLVYTYDQAILRLALRITRSLVDAQDIYQETFLRAFRKLDSVRYECPFSKWINRIATNVCLDHLRKRRKRNETSATWISADGEEYDLLDRVSDDRMPSNPEQQVLGRELGAHILLALTKLTPRERIVFELRHYQASRYRP